MVFEWDEKKRTVNLTKHGLDFSNLHEVFAKPIVSRIDDRLDYGETRWLALAELRGIVIILVYSEDEDVIRFISARRATKNETNVYFQRIHQ